MIPRDTAKEREGESHSEKDRDDDAEVHQMLERFTPFAQKSVHPCRFRLFQDETRRQKSTLDEMSKDC
jgi:hypothetical protein